MEPYVQREETTMHRGRCHEIRHCFRGIASQNTVSGFYRMAASQETITPPIIPTRVRGAPPVLDEVEAELKAHLFWGMVGLGLWAGLPLPFAYLSRKTKQLLE